MARAQGAGRRLLSHGLCARRGDFDRADLARRGLGRKEKGMNFHSPVPRAVAPSTASLIARAECLIPLLRERAADADRNARLARETVQGLRDAGFFRILQPA